MWMSQPRGNERWSFHVGDVREEATAWEFRGVTYKDWWMWV